MESAFVAGTGHGHEVDWWSLGVVALRVCDWRAAFLLGLCRGATCTFTFDAVSC